MWTNNSFIFWDFKVLQSKMFRPEWRIQVEQFVCREGGSCSRDTFSATGWLVSWKGRAVDHVRWTPAQTGRRQFLWSWPDQYPLWASQGEERRRTICPPACLFTTCLTAIARECWARQDRSGLGFNKQGCLSMCVWVCVVPSTLRQTRLRTQWTVS